MRHIATLLLMILLLAAGLPARALQLGTEAPAQGFEPEETGYAVFQGGGMTLEQAVAQVRRQYPGGTIVSAETRTSGGRETHIIKVLTSDGTVKTVRIPGRRG